MSKQQNMNRPHGNQHIEFNGDGFIAMETSKCLTTE
jgi:hypothetical protein